MRSYFHTCAPNPSLDFAMRFPATSPGQEEMHLAGQLEDVYGRPRGDQ